MYMYDKDTQSGMYMYDKDTQSGIYKITTLRSTVANIGMLPLSYWHFVDPVKRHRRHFNKRRTHCIATAEAMILGDEFDFMRFMRKHPNFVLTSRTKSSDMKYRKISMGQIQARSWDYVLYRFGNSTEWETSKEFARMTRLTETEIGEYDYWGWDIFDNPGYESVVFNDFLYDDGRDNIRNMSKMMSRSAWRK